MFILSLNNTTKKHTEVTMSPKEKAEELVLKYLRLQEKDSYNWFNKSLAKQCALIAVDEIIDTYTQEKNNGYIFYRVLDKIILYWQEVKQEIEKL